LSEKVEQFLKRIHESIISQDQEKMQSDLSMILSLIEAHDFDNLHNSIHRIVLKASEND
jgi:thiamine pyrophosphokinase